VTVTTVTPAAIRSWHAGLKTGRTAKAHAYALLKSILRTAVEDELITRNPCTRKGASRVTRSRQIRPATLDELEAIATAMPPRLALVVQLSAWCALRFGEVTELRRHDVDLKAGVIRVRRGVTRVDGNIIVATPKTVAAVRDVHIPPHLIPRIKKHMTEYAQLGRDGLLFYAVKGHQLPHSSLRYHFGRAAEAAGRPDLTPHALRHTGAVLAAQTGATIAELMARLGHTTPHMAMRYQHASAERDLVLAEKLSHLAERSPPA
jgi:integrase